RNGEFLRHIFATLLEHEEGMQAKDVLAKLGEEVEMTEFELGVYPSAPERPRYNKIARFATVSAVKAGWLIKSKGIWHITDEGREAYTRFSDPEKLYREAKRLYREWKSSRPDAGVTDESLEEETEEIRITFEQAEEEAWGEIRSFLGGMPWIEFQDLVAALLEAMGYHVSWVAPPGKDFGVDIVAYTDPLGATNPRIKVQVKRRVESSTNVEGLRAFMSVLGDDDVGIFVSAGGFTKDASDEARMQERRKITLIDLEKLFDLWVEHYSELSEDARRKFPLKPIYFLAPEE
ncbi:MAG: restriction endonuclease, partial [Anaerolineales bacterium]